MTSVSQAAPSFFPASSTSGPTHLEFPRSSSVHPSGQTGTPGQSNLAGLDSLSEAQRNLRLSMRSANSALSSDTSLSLNTEYRGPLIPATQDLSFRRRTLVLCFDGTGDQFDLDNSNVINFFSVLKKGDRKRQLVYYQSGIGTYSVPQVATPLFSRISKTLDLMFANNLHHHVMTGYQFLMQNYKDGDKISIFGFSRGAYTARALAGMIHKVGLLPAGNDQQVPFAYKMYKNDAELGWKQSVAFKKTFSMDVDIDFVGVWDTVASVGLLPTTLPFTKSNTAIKVFRHALSLDERRAKFKPSIYQHITAAEAKRGDFTPPPSRRWNSTVSRGRRKEKTKEVRTEKVVDSSCVETAKDTNINVSSESKDAAAEGKAKTSAEKVTASESRRSESGSRTRALIGSIKRSGKGVSDRFQEVVERVSLDREKSKSGEEDKSELSPDAERDQLEQMYLDRSRRTDMQEVWFAGCHCDVGGGSVPNSTSNSLARIPLRWMIRECFLARTGIQFEADRLFDLGLDPATLYPKVVTPTHPDSLDSPIEIEVPQPFPLPPLSEDSKHSEDTEVFDTIVKQESVSMERTAIHKTRGTEEAVIEKRSRDASVTVNSVEVSPLHLGAGHTRENNTSMSGTLVDYDRNSLEAPDVNVERASIIDEKLSLCSGSHDAINNVSHLEGLPPKANGTLKPTSVPTHVVSKTPVFTALEAQQDTLDARSEVYDQLTIKKYWWILEFIPFRERVQLQDGTWKKKWSINRGRGRVVPQEKPLMVHKSVKLRMEAKDLKYKPRVKLAQEPIWVD